MSSLWYRRSLERLHGDILVRIIKILHKALWRRRRVDGIICRINSFCFVKIYLFIFRLKLINYLWRYDKEAFSYCKNEDSGFSDVGPLVDLSLVFLPGKAVYAVYIYSIANGLFSRFRNGR